MFQKKPLPAGASRRAGLAQGAAFPALSGESGIEPGNRIDTGSTLSSQVHRPQGGLSEKRFCFARRTAGSLAPDFGERFDRPQTGMPPGKLLPPETLTASNPPLPGEAQLAQKLRFPFRGGARCFEKNFFRFKILKKICLSVLFS